MRIGTDLIVRTPDTCGDRARIAGSRVRVIDIVAWHEHQGMSPEEIVAEFPTVTVEGVRAAVDYYRAHREEIDAEAQQERELAEEFRRENPPLLLQKMAQRHRKIS